jgi:hypothetical protein
MPAPAVRTCRATRRAGVLVDVVAVPVEGTQASPSPDQATGTLGAHASPA